MTRAPKSGGPKSGGRKNGGQKSGGPRSDDLKGTSLGGVKEGSKAGSKGAAKPDGGGPRKANRRGAARLAAVQALYQMDMAGAGINEILAQFESHWLGREVEGEQYLPAEAAFFRDIVSGVIDMQRDLDPRIDAALQATWPLKRIEAILRSVLRAGAYELEKRTDIPARVIVSEYVDVANAFVDKTETGMVNAVLDRLARNARAGEFG
jgi:transcription antitermination protein NusB